MKPLPLQCLGLLLAIPLYSQAAVESPDRWAVRGQVTFVEQATGGFHSPYRGPNSLTPGTDRETADITLYLGARLWRGAEFWVNPEIDQGFGLDNTLGAAGFPSGEAYKVGRNQPYLRWPRLFLRDTIDLGGARVTTETQANQFGGEHSADRLVFTVGKFAVTDVFDTNQYAHDPRNDFLNWSALDAGSFDYAADAWGYSVGAAAEWYRGSWAWRWGVFDLSDVPNSDHLEPGFHEFELVTEIERRHELRDHPGRVLLTVYQNRGRMALLEDAIASGNDNAAVRRYRSRLGGSVGFEQELGRDLGAFARIGKSAGNVETYEFTDIDRSVSAGLSLKGSAWNRSQDAVGLAGIVNHISASRARFLDAGGSGILIGDGKLPRAGPERIIETYYSFAALSVFHLTLDYQWLQHPAYNMDRGPVSVYAVRLHAQF